MSALKEIQEQLIDYFKDTDDKTFMAICDILVFHNSTQDSNISKLAEKFLKDNGLNEAYINYMIELQREGSMWRRNVTDCEMINDVKSSLLALAYNRFNRSLNSNPKPTATPSTPISRLGKQEKADLTMVLEERQRHNDDLIDDDDYSFFSKDEAKEVKAERKRLQKLYIKVLNLLK